MNKMLETTRGRVRFPAFFPVTTFGGKFPLDDLVRPYLRRFSPAIMVSYHYARQMTARPAEVLFVDSGGFASLFEGSEAVDDGEHVSIRTKEGDTIAQPEVLAFQEQHADIGATLDFLIGPDCSPYEARRRQQATIKNAVWAARNRQRADLRLYASLQAWDVASARYITEALRPLPFDGFALGGMVPRVKTPNLILDVIRAIREIEPQRPLHVFGIGSPQLMRRLFEAGVDSTDSSSYVRSAADGRYLVPNTDEWKDLAAETGIAPCECAPCRRLGLRSMAANGEANRLGLTLHNLFAVSTTADQVRGRRPSEAHQ